jgi:hypothetical protein
MGSMLSTAAMANGIGIVGVAETCGGAKRWSGIGTNVGDCTANPPASVAVGALIGGTLCGTKMTEVCSPSCAADIGASEITGARLRAAGIMEMPGFVSESEIAGAFVAGVRSLEGVAAGGRDG